MHNIMEETGSLGLCVHLHAKPYMVTSIQGIYRRKMDLIDPLRGFDKIM